MSQPESKAADEPLIRVSSQDGLATLTLNQPQRFNPLCRDTLAALQVEVDAIAGDPGVRVLVLAAEGPAFCAGHDLRQMRANPDKAYQKALFERCAAFMQSLIALPQPVVARVQGVATAAGCQLVASCDYAVASEQARFAVSGVNLGLFCSTPAVALSRKVDRRQALEMLLTGDFIDAQTARERGLINRVVETRQLDDAVNRFADSIKAKPASVIARGKAMFYRQAELPLAQAYDYAAEVMACNMMEHDAREGIDAFIDKRPPRWRT